jgi:putative FmdB family regulatory protein
MPTYVYKCKDCGHHFETTQLVRDLQRASAKPACPKCKSQHVERLPAPFHAVTAPKW